MKNKNQLLYFSYLLVIVVLMLFEVIIYPMMCIDEWNVFLRTFLLKFLTSRCSLRLLVSA